MNKYELMFIVNPTLEEANIKKVADDIKNVIKKSKGKIIEEKEMGQKDLAYEIQKHKKGYYFLFTFEADASLIAEINRISNVNENIIRHLVIKIED